MALVLRASLVIDCDDLSCLTFTDQTGGYSLSNTTGYNTPNKNISDIVSTNFVITDADGNDYAFPASGYLPNSAGNSTIELHASDFSGGLTFVPGATYHLYYEVDFSDSSTATAEEDFTYPCCGSSITSSLTTNFAIEQQIGCQAIVFADTTGSYNVTTNPGGYGTPNPAYGDISSTLITFVLSNGDTVVIDDFIPTGSDFSRTITSVELGYTSGTIADQIVTVTYQVFAEGTCQIGMKTTGVLLYCNTETCINQKITSTLNNDCSCEDTNGAATNVVWEMLMELDSIKYVASKNIGCIDGKIESLYQKCSGGCSTC